MNTTKRYLNAYTIDSNGVSRKQALQVEDRAFLQHIFNNANNGSNAKKAVLEELLEGATDSSIKKLVEAQINTIGTREIDSKSLEQLTKSQLIEFIVSMELTVGGSFEPSAVAEAITQDLPF